MIENTQTAISHFKHLYRDDRELATRNARRSAINPNRQFTCLEDALSSAFTWNSSPEGHEYWKDVHDALVDGTYDVLRADQKGEEYFWHDDSDDYYFSHDDSDDYTTGPLPTDAGERKTYPIYSGFINYFPNAIAAVSHLSYKGSQQHQPDQPTQWDMNKSGDELDALMRHMIDGDWEQVAWRAMANLERKLTGNCQYEEGEK
tara:strand:- start:97 stop:705 length:609 start_codon:yes stop_codon:yes gene_type:complete